MTGDRSTLAVAGSVVAAGVLIAAAIIYKPEPRYTMSNAGGQLTRLDRVSGEMVTCIGGVCSRWKAKPDELMTFQASTGNASDPEQSPLEADQ